MLQKLGSRIRGNERGDGSVQNNYALMDQIVLAQDICMKLMMVKYGGWGYGHILNRVLPRFRRVGISEQAIRTMLVDNPRRLLPFVAPQA